MLYMNGNAIVSNGFRWKGSALMGKCLPRNGARKYYISLPTVYAIPPANSQNRPHVGTRSHNGFTAIRMSQPMAGYRPVLSFGYRTPPAVPSCWQRGQELNLESPSNWLSGHQSVNWKSPNPPVKLYTPRPFPGGTQPSSCIRLFEGPRKGPIACCPEVHYSTQCKIGVAKNSSSGIPCPPTRSLL